MVAAVRSCRQQAALRILLVLRTMHMLQEFGGKDGSFKAKAGTAAAVTKAATAHNMLLLSAGMLA